MCVSFEGLRGGHVMKRMIGLMLGLLLIVTLSGCETIKGVGRDITNAGEALERATR